MPVKCFLSVVEIKQSDKWKYKVCKNGFEPVLLFHLSFSNSRGEIASFLYTVYLKKIANLQCGKLLFDTNFLWLIYLTYL